MDVDVDVDVGTNIIYESHVSSSPATTVVGGGGEEEEEGEGEREMIWGENCR